MLRLNALAALAIVVSAVPAAFAQTDMPPAPGPRPEAHVEVIGTGEAEPHVDAVTLLLNYSVEADTDVAAQAALRVKRGEIVEAVTRLGGDGATATPAPAPPMPMVLATAPRVVAEPGSDEALTQQTHSAAEVLTVRIAQVDRVAAVRSAIEELGVTVSAATNEVGDAAMAAAGRQARQRAIVAARQNAESYAAALGMNLGPVIRVSEAGHGIVSPTMQEEFMRMIEMQSSMVQRYAMGAAQSPELPSLRRSVLVEYSLLP